jgi:hypothetical protein
MVVPGRRLRVQCVMGEGRRYYISLGKTPFDTPPAESDRCPIDGGSFYEVRIDVEDMTPGLTVNLWAIQYDRSERLTHVNMQLAPGENRLPFRANPDARGLRVALRLAGNGHCVLGDPHLYSIR